MNQTIDNIECNGMAMFRRRVMKERLMLSAFLLVFTAEVVLFPETAVFFIAVIVLSLGVFLAVWGINHQIEYRRAKIVALNGKCDIKKSMNAMNQHADAPSVMHRQQIPQTPMATETGVVS